MKKLLICLFIILTFLPTKALALTEISTPSGIECDSNFRVYVDKTKATANNSDKITFTVKFKQNARDGGCLGGGPFMDYAVITSSGSGNTFSRTNLYPTTNIDYFVANKEIVFQTTTLKSSIAGKKNISIVAHIEGGIVDPAVVVGSVTFTAPVTTAPKPTTTTTKTPTIAAPKIPTTPALTDLKIGETQYQASNQYRYEIGNTVPFSGKTIANGKVTLTFNSEPFTDTTTADANGNWTYSLTKNLGEGEHTMTYTVTDPNTNLTSAATQPVSFTLVAAAKTETAPVVTEEVKTDYTWLYVGGAVTALVILASVLGFIVWRRKSKLS